jgi:uncharacterized membrane protein YidH (DUF202 family)
MFAVYKVIFEEENMRNLTSIGLVLIVIGIVALVVQNVRFTETRKVVDLGPLQVRAEEQHNIPIPTVAGIAAIVAGLGLVIVSRRQA